MSPTPRAVSEDEELPELPPLDPDEGSVDIPDETIGGAWEEGDDDEAAGIDPGAFSVLAFDEAVGDDDAASDDEPVEALPDDDRGAWVGDDDRPSDEVAEVDELPADEPDGGEEGPTRDPYDAVDTALPALDDGDDEDEP